MNHSQELPSKNKSKKIDMGRNLPLAILVGGVLSLILIFSIVVYPPVFIVLLALFSTLGSWELSRALQLSKKFSIPLVPTYLGAVALPLAAYFGGSESLWMSFVLISLAILVWRVIEEHKTYFMDILGGIFVVFYVPFLLSFAALIFNSNDGNMRLIISLLIVVANDTFGYLSGVFFGKHLMLSRVSPKKSWEGFLGSILGGMLAGILGSILFLDNSAIYAGAILGLLVAVFATLGDFAESFLKRELHIKDMGTLLPGHGGIMDRLDSNLFALPVAYIIFEILFIGV